MHLPILVSRGDTRAIRDHATASTGLAWPRWRETLPSRGIPDLYRDIPGAEAMRAPSADQPRHLHVRMAAIGETAFPLPASQICTSYPKEPEAIRVPSGDTPDCYSFGMPS